MLVFGHAGITLGVAALLGRASYKRASPTSVAKGHDECSKLLAEAPSDCNHPSESKVSWLSSLANHIDIRVLLLGSLLPDIIDKPVGLYFWRDTFSNGRIFCHTLLFLMIITLAGLYLYRRRGKTWLLVLSFGTFLHLIFDQMWCEPRTLLWPLYGLSFAEADITNWIYQIVHSLLTDPRVFIPELLGAVILMWFALALVRTKKVHAFVKHGQIQ